MATKEKAAKSRDRLDRLPDLIDHRQIAKKLGKDCETVRNWIRDGEWPLPHSEVKTTIFYHLADIELWLNTGAWPAHMKFNRSVAGLDQMTPSAS